MKNQARLKKVTLIYQLLDEHPELTLYTANVYSYMLCKYIWFKSNGGTYFESQETIAEGCRVSVSAVKTATKFLLEHKLLQVTKVPTKNCNRNQYVVVDKYRIYARKAHDSTGLPPEVG